MRVSSLTSQTQFGRINATAWQSMPGFARRRETWISLVELPGYDPAAREQLLAGTYADLTAP
jgi:hypothetical protein